MSTKETLSAPLPELAGEYRKLYRFFRKHYIPKDGVQMKVYKKTFLIFVNYVYVMYEAEELQKGGRPGISYKDIKTFGRKNEEFCLHLLLSYWKVPKENSSKYSSWFYETVPMSYSYGMYNTRNRVSVSPGGPTNRFNKNIYH